MSAKSPCIELCQFDGKTGFCLGCLRTLDECRQWKKMQPFRRQEILRERPKRQAKLEKRA
jgi:predicted Fe-S protein YdhL (DUF1289 family)